MILLLSSLSLSSVGFTLWLEAFSLFKFLLGFSNNIFPFVGRSLVRIDWVVCYSELLLIGESVVSVKFLFNEFAQYKISSPPPP